MAKRNGIDGLGKFEIKSGKCGICKAGGDTSHPYPTNSPQAIMVVQYKESPAVSNYVSQAKSLLIRNKKTQNFIRTIGINCGCYAKVHRQIARINAEAKGLKEIEPERRGPEGSIAGSPGHRGTI